MKRERWREIPGCPGYEVSDLGRVRNSAGRLHEQRYTRPGWLVVNVRGEYGSKRYVRKRVLPVHRVVAAVFLGLEGPVGHRDGDHRNNAAANLVACASEREAKEMSGVLRYKRGAEVATAKLRPAQVRRMREQRERGATVTELGEKYGVAHQLVSRICAGKAWRGI